MPLKGRLTDSEKHRILAGLADGLSVLDLAKELGRDRRIVESYIKSPNIKARKDKGKEDRFHLGIREKYAGNWSESQMIQVRRFFRRLVLLKCHGQLDAVF